MILGAVFTSLVCCNTTKQAEQLNQVPIKAEEMSTIYSSPTQSFEYKQAADAILRSTNAGSSTFQQGSSNPAANGLLAMDYGAAYPQAIFNIAGVQPDPNNREFWYRTRSYFNYYTTPDSSSFTTSRGIVSFRDVDGKALVTIYQYYGKFYYVTFDVDGNVVTKERLIAETTLANSGYDDTTGYFTVDIRILLSADSGFIQIYNSQGALMGEVLGAITADSRQVHDAVMLESSGASQSYRWFSIFAILATSSTMGMVVAPLLPKDDGALQEQAEGNYTKINTYNHLPSSSGTDAVVKVNVGADKKYVTFLTPTPADIGVPANYTVEAVAIAGKYSARGSGEGGLEVSHVIKFTDSTETFSKLTDLPIFKNLDKALTNQARVTIHNVNPKTSVSWTMGDLAKLEIGFKV